MPELIRKFVFCKITNFVVTKIKQLIFPPIFYEHDLCINNTYSLIICTSCETALEPPAVFYHLRNIHKIKKTNLSQTLLDNLCSQHSISITFPVIQGPISQIHGLALYQDYFQCKYCELISKQKAIIERHHQSIHAKEGLNFDVEKVAAQRLSSLPQSKKYFAVIMTNGPVNSNIRVEDLRHKCDAAYASFKPSQCDDRTVSPWLLTTRWPEHFATYDLSKLRKLVEFPSRNEDFLARLEKGVLAVMQGGLGYIVKTPVLVLQELNSPDPVKK